MELATLLKQDGHLQFKFLSKVTHELRYAQRRAMMINRRDAVGRFAMFIAMMANPAPARPTDRKCRCRWRVPTSPTSWVCRSNR